MNRRILFNSMITAAALLLTACGGLSAANPAELSTEELSELELTGNAESESEPDPDPSVPESSGPSLPTEEVTSGSYVVVDSGQTACFDDSLAVPCPETGDPYYGQDAQYTGVKPAYQDNGDGTVTDLNTGLTWIQDAGEKVSYYQGISLAEEVQFAGYDDWRVPTIKELYSLIDFSGIDDAEVGTDPFIDRDYFVFHYGDETQGDRAIDSQWITNTIYVDTVMNNQECFFGVNFADGRIKCYPTREGSNNGYYLRLVRGESYGENKFTPVGEEMVADEATGLAWQQSDSGEGMDWPSALAYCETATTGGQTDWRLPNAKELQSIVDYSRSPGTSGSAAIDPIFDTSPITNLLGQTDYPYFWTSTTHANGFGGKAAVYISFGHGMGQMNGTNMDVHGAGSQRSDPKTGDPAEFPTSVGPQGDIRRLLNYVRCVRGGVEKDVFTGGEADNSAFSQTERPSSAPALQESPAGRTGSKPDLVAAAKTLGLSVEQLQEALGPPPPKLAAAAAALGITEAELITALGLPGDG